MVDMLSYQFALAFGPGFVALLVLSNWYPTAGRIVRQTVRFDMTTVLLFTAGCCFLFALNRAICEIQFLAEQEYRARAAAHFSEYGEHWFYSSYNSAYCREASLLLGMSAFTLPALIFVRLLIDGARDDMRRRSERRSQLSGVRIKVQERIFPTPKPQWID